MKEYTDKEIATLLKKSWKLGKMVSLEYYNSIIDCNKNFKVVA